MPPWAPAEGVIVYVGTTPPVIVTVFVASLLPAASSE